MPRRHLSARVIQHFDATFRAVRLIEATYFDGRDILYAEDREHLDTLREYAVAVIAAADQIWPGNWTACQSAENDAARRARGRARAEVWVQVARAETHTRMGEDGRAFTIAGRLIA